MKTSLLITLGAGLMLGGCYAPPQPDDPAATDPAALPAAPVEGQRQTAGEPTKVTPAADPEAESGPAVPRDEAVPGGPPPAKGGY